MVHNVNSNLKVGTNDQNSTNSYKMLNIRHTNYHGDKLIAKFLQEVLEHVKKTTIKSVEVNFINDVFPNKEISKKIPNESEYEDIDEMSRCNRMTKITSRKYDNQIQQHDNSPTKQVQGEGCDNHLYYDSCQRVTKIFTPLKQNKIMYT